MGMGSNKKLLDHKVQTLTLQRFGRAFTIGLVLLIIALVAIEATRGRYGEVDIEGLFLFPAIFGFASFVFIVMVAKLLRRLLMRDEDYYDHDRYFTDADRGGDSKPKSKPSGGAA